MAYFCGVAGFEELWARRTTIEVSGQPIDLLAMEDLVRAKKTQLHQDWPMIRRLAGENAELARAEAVSRPAVQAALSACLADVSDALKTEEREERRKDREYGLRFRVNSRNFG